MSGIIPAAQWSKAILPFLQAGHTLKIPLTGKSMYPLLLGGRDEAIIASIDEMGLKRGDIVLFTRGDGTYVLHRIHHIKGKQYYMLGDAHTEIEGPIESENVLAIATCVIRKGKRIHYSQPSYKILSELWLILRPLRPFILQAAKFILQLKNNAKAALHNGHGSF